MLTRRTLLRHVGGGLGQLALAGLVGARLGDVAVHHRPRAKRVILLFMTGGVSHVDTFDPKPRLTADDGKGGERKWMGSPFEFTPRSECGTPVSSLFPEVATCMDDVCLVRSMRADHGNHFQATLGMHTGSVTFERPSLGSWVTYGLGTENANLPAFVVLAPHDPYAGAQTWSANFLPPAFQGVRVRPSASPVPDTQPRQTADLQDAELELLRRRNRRHADEREDAPELEARLQSFETAFRMQTEAPETFELKGESDATLASYGVERGKHGGFGWQCLMARRLVERGVRFVELIDVGSSSNWDAHSNLKPNHEARAKHVDRGIAALLRDLRSRGLLDDTLVVWTTEFGRTPKHDKNPTGRGHHPAAFSSWLAGGGVRGGHVHGATNAHGSKVVDGEVRVHDLHATILHLLGYDHERLTYRHAGRDLRLTDVSGRVVTELFA